MNATAARISPKNAPTVKLKIAKTIARIDAILKDACLVSIDRKMVAGSGFFNLCFDHAPSPIA